MIDFVEFYTHYHNMIQSMLNPRKLCNLLKVTVVSFCQPVALTSKRQRIKSANVTVLKVNTTLRHYLVR